jgi:glycosyltransferase involved in cell wall biosynthesis
VFYCGIDLTRFRTPIDKAALRAKWGVPADALVLGHVGRFDQVKNHELLVDIAANVMERRPNTWLMLIGEGQRMPATREKIERLGIADRVVFAGRQADVASPLRSVIDVFVFPSLWEGLPLSVIEAMAAGLPCVISDVISEEVDVIQPLITRMSLLDSATKWAEAVMLAVDKTPRDLREGALAQLEGSPFDIRACVNTLETIYAGC